MIKGALGNCGYCKWSFDLVNSQSKTSDHNNKTDNSQNRPKNNTFITLPFVDGLSQKLQRIFKTYGVATTFKPHTTLRKLLVAPKDPIPLEKRSGCVYQIKCSDCPKSYIGQTGRQLGQRIKEHQSTAPSRNPGVGIHQRFLNTIPTHATPLIGTISKSLIGKTGNTHVKYERPSRSDDTHHNSTATRASGFRPCTLHWFEQRSTQVNSEEYWRHSIHNIIGVIIGVLLKRVCASHRNIEVILNFICVEWKFKLYLLLTVG